MFKFLFCQIKVFASLLINELQNLRGIKVSVISTTRLIAGAMQFHSVLSIFFSSGGTSTGVDVAGYVAMYVCL